MKFTLLGLSMLLASLPAFSQQRIKSKHSASNSLPKEQTVTDVKNDKLNYAIGYLVGKKLVADSIVLKPQMIFEAMKSLTGQSEPMMTEEEIMLTIQAFENEIRAKRGMEEPVEADTSASDEMAAVDSSSAGTPEELSADNAAALQAEAENEAKGKSWLQANKKKDGVKELPSGLQYQIIRKGNGDKPKITSKVLVQYVGTKLDGTIFDSSIERDMPAILPVNGVIKGWTEALQLMSPGAKWKLFVPANLAYGKDGVGPIEPGEMLIFEVELLYVMN